MTLNRETTFFNLQNMFRHSHVIFRCKWAYNGCTFQFYIKVKTADDKNLELQQLQRCEIRIDPPRYNLMSDSETHTKTTCDICPSGKLVTFAQNTAVKKLMR